MSAYDKFVTLSNSDKKEFVELMLEEVLIGIEDEHRPLTKWESNQINSALACLASGLYSAARQAVFLSGSDQSVVSEPEKWFAIDNETKLLDLKHKLESVKNSPVRA